LSANSFSKKDKIIASVTLKNIGNKTGKEVVQLYIRDIIGSLTRPVKELKGFEMTELKPNEEKIIQFTIDEKMLEFYTANNRWEAESGDFKLFIGGNSAETLEANFKLE
jgi:beta-glucosidase